MAGEMTRVRLVFEDRRILSKSQKKEGLDRSWIIVKPQEHPTISDFSSHLLYNFDLYDACPNGIVLSMDGFILPSFESTSLLKDKDIVSVRKKGSSSSDIVKLDDEIDAFELIELPERQHVIPDMKFLAAEELQKEVGGCESDSEEDELQQMVDLECTPPRKSSSKKRKPSSKSHSTKKKKRKLGSVEEKPKKHVKDAPESKKKKTCGGDVDEKKTPPKKKKASDRSNKQEKTCVIITADEKSNGADRCVSSSSPSLQENSKGTGDLSQMSGETKKTISRSSRRKKAKRQWLREKAKLEKEEVLQKQLVLEDNKHSLDSTVEEHQNHVDEIHDVVEEQEDDTGDDVVPVEIRPGHIRFESLAGEDQPLCENEAPMVTNTIQWNGITSKKKGQKWGTEKTAYSKWNESNNQTFSEDIPQTQTANGHLDYEKLMPYVGLPKAGDIVAYRLIELSSSWTPEISSFRVGKISRYNSESKKVMLVPVPEYPLETKVDEEDEDDSSPQPNTSLYNEDGTLEIEYSSLLDIRDVKSSTSNIARRVTAEVTEQSVPETNQKSTSPNQNDSSELHSTAKANGSTNVWDDISQALSLKKEELSQKNGWVKKENTTARGPWSYKALRRSALGPTMDYLRSQKEL